MSPSSRNGKANCTRRVSSNSGRGTRKKGFWTRSRVAAGDGGGGNSTAEAATMFSFHPVDDDGGGGGESGARAGSLSLNAAADPAKAVLGLDGGMARPGQDGFHVHRPKLVVRGEEVGIVVVVLLLWVAAIALFINRWGKIRLMEPYQPYFEPEPPAATGPEVTGAQRTSVFDPRPSLTILPPSTSPLNMGRRPSNLSGFLPPPSLGLPPIPGGLGGDAAGSTRRLSAFLPQRRASYFVPLPSNTSNVNLSVASKKSSASGVSDRRNSFLLAPDAVAGASGGYEHRLSPGGYGQQQYHHGRTSLVAPRPSSSASSRRTSVCTAAEYLMRSGATAGFRKSSWLTASNMSSKDTSNSRGSLASVGGGGINMSFNRSGSSAGMGGGIVINSNGNLACSLQSPTPTNSLSPHEEEDDGELDEDDEEETPMNVNHRRPSEGLPRLFCTSASPVDKKLGEEDNGEEMRVFSYEDGALQQQQQQWEAAPDVVVVASNRDAKTSLRRKGVIGSAVKEEEEEELELSLSPPPPCADKARVDIQGTAADRGRQIERDSPTAGAGGRGGPTATDSREADPPPSTTVGPLNRAPEPKRKVGVSGPPRRTPSSAPPSGAKPDFGSSAEARRSRFRSASYSTKQSEV